LAAEPHLEVEIRTRRSPGGAQFRDYLTPHDVRSIAHQIALIMSVNRDIAARMLQEDRIAITPQMACEDYGSIIGRMYRGASRGHYVHAIVHHAISNAER
jgi:hypothetical protein